MKHAKDKEQRALGWALHAAGLLAVALLLGTFYKVGYARLANQASAHESRIEQLHQLMENSSDVRSKHLELRQELEALEQSLATMHARLPAEMERDSFEDSIHRSASITDFRVEKSIWRTPETTPTYKSVLVTVYGSGSFASACRFLHEVNQLARITKIHSLELETDENSQAYPLQVTFALVYGVESHDKSEKGEAP